MKRILVYCAAALALVSCCKTQEQPKGITETLLLNNFRPVSVDNIPQTFVEKRNIQSSICTRMTISLLQKRWMLG